LLRPETRQTAPPSPAARAFFAGYRNSGRSGPLPAAGRGSRIFATQKKGPCGWRQPQYSSGKGPGLCSDVQARPGNPQNRGRQGFRTARGGFGVASPGSARQAQGKVAGGRTRLGHRALRDVEVSHFLSHFLLLPPPGFSLLFRVAAANMDPIGRRPNPADSPPLPSLGLTLPRQGAASGPGCLHGHHRTGDDPCGRFSS
jgi:hypothetical protein